VIDGSGHPVKLVNLSKLRVEADIEATGNITDNCDSDGGTVKALRTAYNFHRHPETGAITEVSDTPV